MNKPFYPYRGETITLAATIAFGTVRGKPPWANAVALAAPSATLEAITVAFTPKIEKALFYDASLARGSRWNDLTKALTDRNTSTDSSTFFNAMQTGDRLYVACKRQFRGLSVDVDGANQAGTAVLVGEYPNAQRTWTDLSVTDGTVATRTLAQDGLITWTVPTAGWLKGTLKHVTGLVVDGDDAPETEELYWMRLRPDAALTDTSVDIDELVALLNTTVAGVTRDNEGFDLIRIASGDHGLDYFELHPDIGGIALVSASITSAAIVNWYGVPQTQPR